MDSRLFLMIAVAVAMSGCVTPEKQPARGEVVVREVTFNFDQSPPGPVQEFTPLLSGEGAVPGDWQVRLTPAAITGQHVVAQLSDDRTNGRYPLLIYPALDARDVDVWVHFKPISGAVDQAGGIVIRFQDKDNYYIARANALENNVRLYKVVNGQRIQFAGADVKVARGQWHVLKLAARGNHFEVSFEGQKLFDAYDDTFTRAGKVGLWTKADSVTQFDNFKIETYDR